MTNIALPTAQIHLVNFTRIKQAVFWSLIFPVFLYLVFGSIFGVAGGGDYTTFLLTGVIAMTVLADGLFAIGGLIRRYYSDGTLRYLKKMPVSVISYFGGIILARAVILLGVLLVLSLVSYLYFGHAEVLQHLGNILLGMVVGLYIFSFVGLTISFTSMHYSTSDKGLVNIVYFVFLFLSSALYPVRSFNDALGSMTEYLPLEPVLDIMRGEQPDWLVLAIWCVLPLLAFLFLYNRISVQR